MNEWPVEADDRKRLIAPIHTGSGGEESVLLFLILFLLIRGLQWPLLLLLFSAYNPLVPTGVRLKSFIVCLQTWHSKIKVSS